MISTFEGVVQFLKAKKDGTVATMVPVVAEDEESDGKKKKKKSKKGADGDDKKEKKTRAPSAYNLFMRSVADQVKAKVISLPPSNILSSNTKKSFLRAQSSDRNRVSDQSISRVS
jgi:hypothetical protein